jgi:hypothetical protein
MLGFAGAGDFLRDFGAGAETRIDQPMRLQMRQRLGIGAHARGLAQGRFIPGKAQPFEVIEDGLNELVAATPLVDILDPQQKIVAAFISGDRGQGVAQMQEAGWTGCEPCDNHRVHHGRAAMPSPGLGFAVAP